MTECCVHTAVGEGQPEPCLYILMESLIGCEANGLLLLTPAAETRFGYISRLPVLGSWSSLPCMNRAELPSIDNVF